jgi:hypothetical protein
MKASCSLPSLAGSVSGSTAPTTPTPPRRLFRRCYPRRIRRHGPKRLGHRSSGLCWRTVAARQRSSERRKAATASTSSTSEPRLDPDWFRFMLRASETGLLAEGELAAARQDMTPEQYDQEFECSFDAAILGAYYGKDIAELERKGRIKDIEPVDGPVHTAWDLGIGDSARPSGSGRLRQRDSGHRPLREPRAGHPALRG